MSKDYLARLFSEYDSVNDKSPEEIEQEVNQEAEMLVKQQSKLEKDMYYNNRYFSDMEEEVNDGIYDTTPEEDAILEQQHLAELDPNLSEDTVVFSDADGELTEVEHYDEDGNPIHPEVIKQALYDEYLATQDESDEEGDESDEEKVIKQALFDEYLATQLYADDEEGDDEDEDEESDEEKVIKQALFDEFMEAQTREYSNYYEPETYFYADDEVDEEGEGQEEHDTQELHSDDSPAVEVLETEAVKKQASIHQIESSVNKYL